MTSGSFRIQFKIQTDRNSSETSSNFKKNRTQIGLGGNFPAQGTQVDWVVDLGVDWGDGLPPPPRSTGESTWGSTSLVGLVHLFWLLGPVLEACDDF